MPFPPDVYLIGAEKSGTTSIANLLDSHPDIEVSEPKEPNFLTNNYHKGISWYKKRFNNLDKILVDASTSYTKATSNEAIEKVNPAPYRAHNLNPNAKFIYVLRNPIERTYSGYWHGVRYGRITDEFSSLIRSNDFRHLDISYYYKQLCHWIQYYPIDSFLIIKFEDFQNNPEKILKECLDFIGVNTRVELRSDSHENKSYEASYIGKKINKVRSKFPVINNAVKKIVPNNFRNIILRILHKKNGKIPPMNYEDKEYLRSYFYYKNKELEKLTGVSIEEWNRV